MPLSREEKWNVKFEALVEFQKETGHCRVPWKHPVLGTWANDQRTNYNKKDGTLSAERAARLEAIGFETTTREESFNAKFDALVEFKRGAGHCGVPRSHPVLGHWVGHVRQMYKKNGRTLPGDRLVRLEALGFAFEPGQGCAGDDEVRWEARCEELEDYKRRHGHCNVPNTYPENHTLRNWVKKQRDLYRKGTLAVEREVHLSDLGFEWGRSRVTRGEPSRDSNDENSGAGEGELAKNNNCGLGSTATKSGKKRAATTEGEAMDLLRKQLAEVTQRHLEVAERLATVLCEKFDLQKKVEHKESTISDMHHEAASRTAEIARLKSYVKSSAPWSNERKEIL